MSKDININIDPSMSDLDRRLLLMLINHNQLAAGFYSLHLDGIEYRCHLPQHLVRYQKAGEDRYQAFDQEAFAEGAQGSIFEASAYRFTIDADQNFQFRKNKTDRVVKREAIALLNDSENDRDSALSHAKEQSALEKEINGKESKAPVFLENKSLGTLDRTKLMHRLAGCTLEAILKSEEYQQNFTLSESVSFMLSLAKDLKRYHDKKAIHYDVKPSNVMIETETGRIRLIDLDSMEKENPEQSAKRDRGTFEYAAPEARPDKLAYLQLIQKNRKISHENQPKQICKIDIFSLGRVFSEMLHNLNETAKAPHSDEIKGLNALTEAMLSESQENRLDINQVIVALEAVENKLMEKDFLSLRDLISNLLTALENNGSKEPARKTLVKGLENSLIQLGSEVNKCRESGHLTRKAYDGFYTTTYNLMNDAKELFGNKNLIAKFFNGLTRPISFIVFGIVKAVKKEKTSVKQELYHKEGFFYNKDAEAIYQARQKIQHIEKRPALQS